MMLYAKIAAIVIALGIAYWQGYSTMRDKHLLFVAEVKRVGEAQEAANKSAVEIAEVISEGVKNEYEARIATLRSQYSGRVRQCSPSSGQVPRSSATTSRADDLAADSRLAGLCAETTQQLISLQQWIIKQQEVTNRGQ
jgi:hypothetical protein